MVKTMKSVLFVMIVVAYFAMISGDGIKCYTCESAANPKCAHNVDEIPSAACGVDKECLKIVTDDGKINRACDSNATQASIAAMKPEPEVFKCATELCNGVSSIAAGLSTILALIAVFIVGFYN